MPFEVPFRCEVVPEQGGVRARVVGSLDMATAPELDARLTELCAAGHRLLVIDLGELEFMDSSGLRLLLHWDAYARRDGISVELAAGPPAVQRLFEITGTAGVFTFRAPSLDEAPQDPVSRAPRPAR